MSIEILSTVLHQLYEMSASLLIKLATGERP